MIRAIFFDFDGVLADTEMLHFEAFKKVFAAHDFKLTEKDYFDKYIGYDDKGAFKAFFKKIKASKKFLAAEFIETLITEKTRIFQALIGKKNPVYKPVPEMLTHLSKLYPLAIVSGALRHEIEMILGAQNLLGNFELLVTAEDCKESKPAPEPYELALKKMNKKIGEDFKPEEILVVEDSQAGVQSAKAAGMRIVGVLNSYTTRDDLAKADQIIASVGDLSSAWLRKF